MLQETTSRFKKAILLRSMLRASIVSLSVLSLLVHNGMFYTLSTILYPQLNVTKYQNACIASLLLIGALLGSLSLGPVSDKIGRWPTSILSAVLTAVTWAMLMSLPDNFDLYILYIIRLISGFAMSLANVSIIYVSEVTNKHWRPVFLGVVSLFMAVGVPISAVLGTIMPWRSYAFFNFVVALFNIIILLPLPESPHWLLHSQPASAKNVLMKLNKNVEDFNEEWKAMEARRLSQDNNHHQDVHLMSREVRRPMLYLAMLFLCQQIGGVYIVTTYALQILTTITQPSLPNIPGPPTTSLPNTHPAERHQFQLSDKETLCFIGTGVIRVVMSGLNAYLSKHIDNRTILVWASAGAAFSAFSLTLAFSGIFGPTVSLVPLAFLMLFQLFESFGIQTVPWSLMGQLIPLSYRAKGSGILVAFVNILMFIIFMGFPYALDLIGLSYCFLFFGIVATVACLFAYFYIPETRGKTFAEIEECFK